MPTNDRSADMSTTATAETVRLSVNISADVAETLQARARGNGISITEAVGRAIAVWDFFESEQDHGNVVASIERDGAVDRVREVVMTR